MRLRIYKAGIASVASAAVLLAFAAVDASATACEIACSRSLVAGTHAKRWITPQRFGAVPVVVSVEQAGHFLPRTVSRGGCKGVYHGHGLRVVVRVCGDGEVPIRFTYRATTPGRKPFAVAWESG